MGIENRFLEVGVFTSGGSFFDPVPQSGRGGVETCLVSSQ